MEHKRHSAERRQPTVDLTQQSMEQERNNRNSSSSGRVDMGSQSEDGDRRQSAESNDKMARRLANKAGIYSIFITALSGELRKKRLDV